MAVVYTENFAAGNSTFSNQNVYDTPDSPNAGSDPYDPVYPEIVAAESVRVIGGKLDWNGTYGDYSSSGIVIKTATPWDGSYAYMRWTYTPNATSLALSYAMPVIPLGASNDYVIQVMIEDAGQNIEITPYNVWDATPEGNAAYNFQAGVEYRFYLKWKCGTVVGDFDDVLTDGWLQLYVNEVLVHERLNISLYVDYNNNNFVDKAWIGYYGLFGALSYLEFGTLSGSSSPSTSVPDPVLVDSVPTVCCEPGSYTPAATAGPILPMNDPTWTKSCAGGGTVPTAADNVDPESWVS